MGVGVVIITRTPLRITLGGGGTDIPSYYRKNGPGFLIAAAITKYIYIAVNRNFDDDLLLKYSELERVNDPRLIKHSLIREAILETGVSGVEISSMADIPSGTGLGSSGAFTVGLLKALYAYKHDAVSHRDIAKKACEIEIERLSHPSGKQDQYISAIGGITSFFFGDDESVMETPLSLNGETRHALEDNLLLFYTGIRRNTRDVLATPEITDEVRDIGYETGDALLDGDMETFGELLTEQWQLKLEYAPTPVHKEIDEIICTGIDAGAVGGKLVGAGDGGFVLFYAEDKRDLRAEMQRLELEEIRFGFDYQGTTTLVAQ